MEADNNSDIDGAKLYKYLWLPTRDEHYHKCIMCKNEFRQEIKRSGYGNLRNHTFGSHSDWKEMLAALEAEAQATDGEITDERRGTLIHAWVGNNRSIALFKWLDWIITSDLPFAFVEDPKSREYTKINLITTAETIKRLATAVEKAIQVKIKEEMPQSIGLMFDGWDRGDGSHVYALFACYKHPKELVKGRPIAAMPLLAACHLVDQTSFTAASIKQFLETVMEAYGKTLNDVAFIVADNTTTNRCVADNLLVPFVGCASHRLNLACKMFLEKCEPIISKIEQLMKKLKTPKIAGEMRARTDLHPAIRNTTRWSSTYNMIKRYLEFRKLNAIDVDNPEIAELMPSPHENLEIDTLFKDLSAFQESTKFLQTEHGVSLATVRLIFDGLIDKFSDVQDTEHRTLADKYLGENARIVHSAAFETAVVKVINNKASELSELESYAIRRFKKSDSDDIIEASATASAVSESPPGFLKEIFKRQRLQENESEYDQLDWIPPTSNRCERLFSRAKLSLGYLRHALTPERLQTILMLSSNRSYWNVGTVGKIVILEDAEYR